MSTLDAELLATLTRFDTPTVCNALEIVVPEQRTSGFTTRHLHCLNPDLAPMVGYARTATIRAVAPPASSAAEVADKRRAYYEYVAAAPTPTVVVIQDLDPTPGFGVSGARSTPLSTRGSGRSAA